MPLQLPDYYLPRPPLQLDAATIAGYESLWAAISAAPMTAEIAYSLPTPRWQFLCYLADHKPVVLHGSGNPDIAVFEPRKANDMLEFGNRAAVYAAADGIWPMYYAILDREHYPMSLNNAGFRVAMPPDAPGEPYYFFSISQSARVHQPWRAGTVYILPRDSFSDQPPLHSDGAVIHILQSASLVPVTPLAKLRITPEDFPFLDQIRGHDDELQRQRAEANPNGFPWLDE